MRRVPVCVAAVLLVLIRRPLALAQTPVAGFLLKAEILGSTQAPIAGTRVTGGADGQSQGPSVIFAVEATRTMDSSNDVELLSCSDVLVVYECTCGCVHMRIGMFTLNLTREEFREFAKSVGEASVRLTVRDVVDGYVNVH